MDEKKSKTQVKREMLALQDIGKRIVELPKSHLARIPLSDTLRQEVAFARSITTHGAKRRQVRRIGALLREVDIEPIVRVLNDLDEGSREDALRFQRIEAWRDTLIAGDDALIEELCTRFPSAERQHLRALVRAARSEHARQKTGRAARALFRHLRELAQSADGTPET